VTTTRKATGDWLGLVGAVAGAIVGYYTFQWLGSQGFYGLLIPGTLLGLGCGLLSRQPSRRRGLLCAVSALALGLVAEWRFAPFRADPSLAYFLGHAHQLKPVTWLLVAGGAALAFFLAKDSGFRIVPAARNSTPDDRPRQSHS
jgi:hypothetical protein